MTTDFGTQSSLRQQQDDFQSMVGGQGAYPDDPQHPDPTFHDAGVSEVPAPRTNPATEALSQDRRKTAPASQGRSRMSAASTASPEQTRMPSAKKQNEKDDRTLMDKARDFLDKIADKADDMSDGVEKTISPKNPPFPTDDDPYIPTDRKPANPAHREPAIPTANGADVPAGRATGDPARDRVIESQMYGEHEI